MATTQVSRKIGEIYKLHYGGLEDGLYSKLCHSAYWYLSVYPLPEGYTAVICDIKLRACVRSFLLDIIKYKEYHLNSASELMSLDYLQDVHGAQNVNKSKSAAFLVKWLVRMAPIAIYKEKEFVESPLHFQMIRDVNEAFAISYVLEEVFEHPIELIGKDLFDDLIYHVRYRTIDDRSLIMIFSLLERHMNLLLETQVQP